jgi:nitrite reductase (cytochrome c-552)
MSWKEILTLKDWFSYRQKIGLLVVAAKYGHTGEIPVPDYSTKAMAQEAIGLDIQKL